MTLTHTSYAGPGLETGSQLRQGFSQARLDHIGVSLQEQIDAGIFPGAVSMVVRNDECVHFEAHGHQDAAGTIPMARDSIFRLASMTKPIVTVAAMMLVERGRFNLYDPITRWLPELKHLKVEAPEGDVPLIRPITVQDLMRHTAGFVHGDRAKSPRISKLYDELQIEARDQDILPDQMLKNLGTIPLAHQPGTFWEYSVAVDVLGLMLERIENKSLEDILSQLLLKPLGMTDTTWWVEPTRLGRLAEAPDADPLKAEMLKAYRQTTNPVGRTYLRGGAGLLGTAADYMKFLQMMLRGGELDGKRYLSRKTVELMCSEHTAGMGGSTLANTGPGYGFGLGFAVRLSQGMCWVPGSIGEALWSGVWGTSFWLDYKENMTALILTQGPSHKIQSRMLYKTLVYSALVK
jgi:CubicO group peptidase (beta-lactamase class C family)